MGLLDEAIREHLELKRRRGADPGEIAHQEQAALSPVFPPEETDAAAVAAPPVPDVALHAGEETAEIDMQAVLDGEDVDEVAPGAAHADTGPAAPVAAPARQDEPSGVLDDDALEWEMPGESAGEDGVAPEIPGQEKMSFE